MPTEREAVHQYLRLEFHLAAGFILPDHLCPDCARQLFAFFADLQTLDELLAEQHHECWHRLTAVTVLNSALYADAELIQTIGEDIGLRGWGDVHGQEGAEIIY